jgi:hypothetical protein
MPNDNSFHATINTTIKPANDYTIEDAITTTI